MIRHVKCILRYLAVPLLAIAATGQRAHGVNWDPDNNPLTVGPFNEFMVGLYAIGAYSPTADAEMADTRARGFNVVHSYSFRNQSGTQNPALLTPSQYITKARSHLLSVMMQLGVVVPSEPDNPLPIPADIQALAVHDNIAMWSIVPEEISWLPLGPGNTQFAQLQQWANNIHANDPKQRPVYHYLASNYAELDLSAYTGFIDAVTAGAYTDYASKPRPWIRWRIEQEVNAIRNTGNREGTFPTAVLQMFASEGNPGETMMQPNDGYHDAYLSLVSGAKAVIVFTGGRRHEIPGLYDRYSDFAREINGPDRLGEVFLKGADLGEFAQVKPTVLSGPANSESFTISFAWPPSGPSIQYDSISYRVMAHKERLYLAAVNSAEQAVTASFPAIRSAGPIDVLFQNRQVTSANEQFTDSFVALGANNYRLPADSSLIVAQESFNGPSGVVSGWTPVHGNGSIVNSMGVTTVHRGTAAVEYLTHNMPSVGLPLGAYLELQVKADPGTAFYLELVDPQGGSAALMNWQGGTGDWQTVRADIGGSWRPSSSLWLGIQGGTSYEVGQLGIYFRAPSNNSWSRDGGGNWNDIANWLGSASPNGIAQSAVFGGSTSPATVYTNSNVTVSAIDFDNANSYAIAGQGVVTLDAGANDSTINVWQGVHELQAVVHLGSNTVAQIQASTKLSLNNALYLNGNTFTVSGAGTLAINNSVYAGGGNIVLQAGAIVAGSGQVGGNVTNLSGQISPGNSPGALRIVGDYLQGPAGSLLIEVAGTFVGAQYDQLTVAGTAMLAGELKLVLADWFEPKLGDHFDVLAIERIQGQFDCLTLPPLDAGLAWERSELYTRGRLSIVSVPEPTTTAYLLMASVVVRMRCGRPRRCSAGSFRRHHCF